MIPLIGYADTLSLRPGQRIAFKVSSTLATPYRASLVRLRCADPNPAGPGIQEQAVPAAFEGEYPSREQPIRAGSSVRVADTQALAGLSSYTATGCVWPTLPGDGEQVVMSALDGEGRLAFALLLNENGVPSVRLSGDGTGAVTLSLEQPLAVRRWYRLWLAVDVHTGSIVLGAQPLPSALGPSRPQPAVTASISPARLPAAPAGGLAIAALAGEHPRCHFNGKIERPCLLGRAAVGGEVPSADAGDIAACWDFSRDMSSTQVCDIGPHALHGRLLNLPTRAVTGSNWTGQEHCWRHAPQEYGAIHFHDDDLTDCDWQTDFVFDLPDNLPSGLYGARLEGEGHTDTIPFVVCAAQGQRGADLAVIIPTFTYAVYGNHARPEFGPAWRERQQAWQSYPHNPAVQREYGLSTYNVHRDGSGICHASALRPLLNLRPGYVTFPESRGSGLRHLQADTHLLWWLEQQDLSFDLLSDREVHEEGETLLADYRCVLTTTHPEYHTPQTLDALQRYRDGGGRLVYLGGNGFYWRVALHPEDPRIIEIRRGEGGIRAWAAEPGEYWQAFDGGYGGLWRRNARPPQRLAGVGFSAQGVFIGSYYRRSEASYQPRFAWMFEGLQGECFGDHGLCGGGAAGFELDRADRRLGTPDHAVVLASSEGHEDQFFVLVPEEQLTHLTTLPGDKPADLVRADVVFFETPGGGAVFSVGSITFCGSLVTNGCDNDVSRLLGNVVRRFLDPAPGFGGGGLG